MVVKTTLEEGYRTTNTIGKHVFYSDEPVSAGGTDTAPTPTDLALGALASCMAMTAKMYAEQKGWTLESVEVEVDFKRFTGNDHTEYEGDELYVHDIYEKIVFHGDLDDKQRRRLSQIAHKCPVRRLIATPTFWKEFGEELETLGE